MVLLDHEVSGTVFLEFLHLVMVALFKAPLW
jgi:hypothetical protein